MARLSAWKRKTLPAKPKKRSKVRIRRPSPALLHSRKSLLPLQAKSGIGQVCERKHLNTNHAKYLGILAVMAALMTPKILYGGQQPETPTPKPLATTAAANPNASAKATTPGAVVLLTLQEALNLARKNSIQLQAAVTDAGVA